MPFSPQLDAPEWWATPKAPNIGYRSWLRDGREPAYLFGFGLGYTTWGLHGPLSVVHPNAESDVTPRVDNTGSRAGKQVIQAYLCRAASAVERPVRRLAAFAHGDGGWRYEPGGFTLHIGISATDLRWSRCRSSNRRR